MEASWLCCGQLALLSLGSPAPSCTAGMGVPQPIFINTNTDTFTGGFMLHPLIVLDLKLALVTTNRTGGL